MKSQFRLVLFIITLFVLLSFDSGIQANETLVRDLLSQAGLLRSEFVFEGMEYTECHSPTIVETKDGIIAAWMSGRHKKHYDVGVWYSTDQGKGWSEPKEIVRAAESDGHTSRLWNPSMFQVADGPLLLFYRNGTSPHSWWGMMMRSDDAGKTWSAPERLPEKIYGPTKNKPIKLNNGTLFCGSSREKDGWRVVMESTNDLGRTWARTDAIADPCDYRAIQPTILTHHDGKLQILCRAARGKRIVTSFSKDNGKTWTPLEQIHLPNASAGIDAITLKDGRFLLVYNHTNRWKSGPDQRRERLNVAVSDDGINFKAALLLEYTLLGEFAYPAVIQSKDGTVHIVYSWNRHKLKYVKVDPDKLVLRDIHNSRWP